MKTRAMRTIHHGLRKIRRGFAPETLFLLYHRVAARPADPQLLCVTPEHFAEHLDIVRKSLYPMSLRQFVQRAAGNRLPRHSVVIIFDDGYTDNAYATRDLLEHHDLPATIFVTSGYVDQRRELWWDELERLLLQPGSLPEILHLPIDGRMYCWELGAAAHYREEEYQRLCGWNVLIDADPSPRHQVYRSLCTLLRPLQADARRSVLDLLARACLDCAPSCVQNYVMTADDLARLGRDNLIEIGAHTVSHPVLAALSSEEQQQEIQQSKQRLEQLVGRPIESFAYPYGARADYTPDSVAAVRSAGFRCACANVFGVGWHRTDQFQIPRVVVRDCDGAEFERQLREWLGD